MTHPATSTHPATPAHAAIEPLVAPNRSFRMVATGLAVVIGICWLKTCFVFVDEAEVVIVERLGTVVGVLDQPADRGLALKLPWPMGSVRRFDRRLHLFDPPGREVFTRDKKNITVDAWVCWRIAVSAQDGRALVERPAVRFFRSVGSVEAARSRLETRVRSTLATRIAEVELSDLMRVADPESPPEAEQRVSLDSLAQRLVRDVRQRPDETESVVERLGIEIVDVRIKRINFPSGNQQAVFERMKSERQKIADGYRSAGLAQNTVIRSQADRQYSEIISRADSEAERIRGQAEAESLAVLNAAHARDPEFYRIVRTLDAYRAIFRQNTTLVLSASSSLMKLLIEGIPNDPAQHDQPGTSGKNEVPIPLPNAGPGDVPPGTGGISNDQNEGAAQDGPDAQFANPGVLP